jgi:hypothetical protein
MCRKIRCDGESEKFYEFFLKTKQGLYLDPLKKQILFGKSSSDLHVTLKKLLHDE